ncbi:MAG: hypothetical protein HY650_00140 [Acidobacteria bacterium]|nr:hypothetical protein [Acidobacteriota bacterium]
MSELEPKGESLRRAIRWISEMRQSTPNAAMAKLVEMAGIQFDLSPADEEFLWRTFVAKPEGTDEPAVEP